MAYINGNKPIITNGLVYALDFGNPKSYTTGSNRAVSLVYDPATTIVTGSTAIPTLSATGLTFSGSQFIQRSASLSALDPNGTFTICAVVKANTSGTLFTQNSAVGNLSGRFQSTSSLSTGFSLASGDFSRAYQGIFTGSQHITYRYNSGSFDTFINGIPVTASQANAALTGSGLTSTLFINSGSLPFSGSLSSFYVYNRALTPDEIYQNFQIASTRYGLRYSTKPYTIDENLYQFLQTTGITDTVTTTALATFISGLKSNGLWNKMVAIYPFVSNTTSSLTTNLKEPGIYRLGLTGSFSASSAGLTPSSSTAFIDTIPGNTAYASVNSQSAHLTVLSYDLPQTSSYPAAIVGGVGATGGEVSYAKGKVIHTFKSGSSLFTPIHPSITAVEVLVVAGGGGGGFYGSNSNYAGGGGGAGGLIYSSSYSVTPLTSYTTTVGQGGAAAVTQTSGSNGGNSQFDSITTLGGGGGGAGGRSGYLNSGSSGGSGGGAGSGPGASEVIPHIGGSGSIGQGNNGGNVFIYSIGNSGAGGGGAGGAAPTLTTFVQTSPGGSGSVYLIGGQSTTYAQGGAGGTGFSANQGLNGIPNTGNGGGGDSQGPFGAGNGGSGVIIVSYPAIPGNGPSNGFFITETSITGSSNSEFSGGITGSGNIGFLTVSRTGSNSFVLAKNTTQTVVNIVASGSMNPDFYFGAANLAGGTASFGNANIGISYASIGAGLTTSEVATYHNLVGQLQTNLKRKNTLLDNYTGAAAAYSLRRIGPSGYFGPAIKVRRDSDNTLRDIGFTSDGQLDTVGLLDFVGVTGSGFVNTWYDQSGNGYDASQATTTAQPFIVTSGSIEKSQNRYTIRTFTGGFIQSNALPAFDYFSFYSLVAPITTGGSGQASYVGIGSGGSFKLFFGYGPTSPSTTFYNKGGSNGNTSINMVNDIRKLITVDANFNNLVISLNGVLENTQNVAGITGGGTVIKIGNGYSTETKPSLQQELILYTSSRRDISSNINSSILSAYTTGSDTDYQSFITATGITQPTQSAALETLVLDLKSYGLWNKMKAIYPMITDKNNRFAYSQELNTEWNPVNTVVATNNVTAPDGTLTAERLTETTSSIISYTVTNNGASAYTINGSDNPTLTLERGKTYQFNISATGHPFYIMTGSGAYTAGGQYDVGVTGQGTQSGTLTFVVPSNAPSTLAYVCQFHSSMGNTINIINNTDTHYIYQTIADGLVTGSEYVTSIYGKFLNRPWIAMETNAGAKAWFNIQTGVTGSLTGSNATITAVSGGWYRCALYFTSSVASGPQNIQYHLADANGNLSYAGVAGTGSYLWGAQFENGNLVGPYRATTTVGFTTGSMLDQMKYNLKNSADTDAAFRLAFGGLVKAGYNGISGDNLVTPTTYINTYLNASASFVNTSSVHGSIYQITGITKASPYASIGFGINTDFFNYVPGLTAGAFSTGVPVATYGTSKAFHIASITSPTSNFVARNGVVKAVFTSSAALDNRYTLLGSSNNPSTPTQVVPLYGDGNTMAFSTIGDGLTDYEAKALYWIVQKYQTTLGRQVY